MDMTQIQTSRDIFTTISLRAPEFNNPMSLTVKYRISQRNILTGKDLPSTDAQVRVIDQAEQVTPTFDEDGNPDGMTTTPAITDLTDLIASATTPAEFWNAMLQKAIEHADLTEWDGQVLEDIENDPDAATPVEWSEVIGQLIAPPNQVIFDDFIYSVVQAHTAAAQWPPNIVPALFALVGPVDGGGGNELPAWQPWPGSGPTYAVGDQVSHNGSCWESATPNNTFEPGAPGIGDNIWFQITCP